MILRVYNNETRNAILANPGHALINVPGTALLLADPEDQFVLAVFAPEGKNFHNMTEDEANQIIVDAFTE